MRVLHLTFVSDGQPRRRLLIGSKKEILEIVIAHDKAPSQFGSWVSRKRLAAIHARWRDVAPATLITLGEC